MDEFLRLLELYAKAYHLAMFSKKLHGKTQAERLVKAEEAKQKLFVYLSRGPNGQLTDTESV